MRPEEVLLLAAGLAVVISLLYYGNTRNRLTRTLSALSIAVLVVHFWRLRLYWQISAAYLAVILLGIMLITARKWSSSRIRSIAALLLIPLGFSTAALIVLPFFELPPPTGPLFVGTHIVHMVDEARADDSFPSGKRELMIQIWYPSAVNRGVRAPYRRLRETTLLSSYDAVLKTHSLLNAPILRESHPYPVILFNPAWEGQRTQNTFQMEDLASHGFVVVAIDHTHNSTPVAFPDGKIVRRSEPREIDDFSGPLEKQIAFGEQETITEAKDDIAVLNQLAAWSSSPGNIWYGLLDTNHTGAFGHSFGGSVAIEACFRDPRIRAALNIDGWMFGKIYREPLNKPLMMMYDSGWPFIQSDVEKERLSTYEGNRLDINDLNNLMRSFHDSGGYLLGIQDTKHMNFADRSLYSPFHKLTDSGTLNPKLVHSIINRYTLAFFSHTLRGTTEPLLNQTSPFPETYFRAYPDPRIQHSNNESNK
ncbi:alpha/beta hydrolase family protein [Acidipila rosea]|uniref:Putative dienelactone hydrolase n=1 Tax=Acidipila rosea TaxID=768535 RepID=A0A4R1LCY8_9BACT|nr:hypothetical protein [Acidipila rosea]MBW4027400.1 hypothetical protein [Acidobacteriota bacterium]TCK75527.1 putative dienelactone hydrolase [Acidipila rosea]